MRAPIGNRPGRRLRRAARLLAWVVATPLLLLTLVATSALLYARSEGGRANLRSLVLARARARVPGLELGRIDGGYLRDLVLRDVQVRDGDGRVAIHVDVVSLRFDLRALLHRTVAVKDLRLDGVRLLVRPQADGTLNVAHLVAPSPAGGARSQPSSSPSSSPWRWNVHLDRLAINELRADVQWAPEAPPLVVAVDVRGRAVLDGGRLGASIEELDVVAPGGRLRAEGGATLEDLATALPRLIDYRLDLSIHDVDPSRWAAKAPAGRLGLTALVHGAGVPLRAGGDATLAIRMEPSELAGVAIGAGQVQASLAGTRWQLATASVDGPGFGASLSGQGNGRQVALALTASWHGRLPGPPGAVSDVRGRGKLAARVTGTLPDVDVTADGDVADLRAGRRRLGRAVVQINVAHPLTAPRGSLHLTARGADGGRPGAARGSPDPVRVGRRP